MATGYRIIGGSNEESGRISHVKESQRLAFVVERITEIAINQKMASMRKKPSASSSAQEYARALKVAFGIGSDDHDTISIGDRHGRHELPKTIAAVVGRYPDGSLRVLLGQNRASTTQRTSTVPRSSPRTSGTARRPSRRM
ncbi:hypothetical protein [Sorangium sp. So ce362]|uniref:hypothetical protein n=1 Tax=Sorangium sp. So ce362 TaxID=3133303 RepID=UPI003F60AAC5